MAQESTEDDSWPSGYRPSPASHFKDWIKARRPCNANSSSRLRWPGRFSNAPHEAAHGSYDHSFPSSWKCEPQSNDNFRSRSNALAPFFKAGGTQTATPS
eukprot:32264-Eustigmatos_ZCMA.PRE.1